MKLLFIAPRFHTNFYYPIKVLLEHHHSVDFFVLYKGVSEKYDLIEPTVLGYSPVFKWWNKWRNPMGGKLIKTQYELRFGFPPIFLFFSLLFKTKPDVLVIKDIGTSYSLLALTAGFLFRKKMIVFTQIPKYREQKQSQAVRWLWWLFKTKAVTPVLGEEIFTNDNQNLVYLPFVAPVIDRLGENLKHKDSITILCVGKFQARKNQLLLLKAVDQLKKDFPIKLWLVGQRDEVDYFSQIKTYIDQHGLQSIVEIFIDIPWGKIPEFYRTADIFVLPSYKEAAAYSLLEAMAYGLPVLSSNDNGTRFYIKEGENGFIFDPFDLRDLTSKLRKIISDKNNLIEMGKLSHSLANSIYHPDAFYKKFMELIKSHD